MSIYFYKEGIWIANKHTKKFIITYYQENKNQTDNEVLTHRNENGIPKKNP